MVKRAKDKGAQGINIAGICCGNEILMRHGIPIAGNFSNKNGPLPRAPRP
jgi:carbon-monoxide dehydrogenase catalytic subunit